MSSVETLMPDLAPNETTSAPDNERPARIRAKASALVAPTENAATNAAQLTSEQPRHSPSGRTIVLQRWSGFVTEVSEETFRAEISDLDEPLNPREEVVLSRGDIPRPDIDLLRPGALFFWHLGKVEERTGTLRRFMEIRFRRVPAPSQLPALRFSSIFAHGEAEP